MRARLSRSTVAAATFGIAACITVNIYFPAPQVRAAAEEIVEETWGGGDAGGPQSSLRIRWFGPKAALAADSQPDVDIETAAIRKIKESMKTRSGQLKPWLSTGNVGIDKNGMLVVRELVDVALRDQATVRGLVKAENRDREALYAEIAEANDYPRERVADIRKIFADTWRAKAESGWPVQRDDGSWANK